MKQFLIALFIIFVCLCGCGIIGKADTPLRNADYNEFVNLGDSVFANSGDINNILYDYADGTFRHYSRNSSTLMGSAVLNGKPIPQQFDEACSDDPDIEVVYLDGGADDILVPFVVYKKNTCVTQPGKQLPDTCKDFIDDLGVAADNLLDKMHSAGVDHVIWMGYYHIKKGTYGDTRLNPAVDYGNLVLGNACNSALIDCIFVDPRNAFKGHESTYIINDGLHPSYAGSRALADLLWAEIKKHL